MSRSKKAPVWTDGGGTTGKTLAKRRASRRVRSKSVDETPASGKAYRKEFNPLDICDWKFHDPKNPKARRK